LRNISAQGGELRVDGGGGDGACGDIDKFVAVVAVEADHGAFGVHADAVAVSVFPGGCDGGAHRHFGEATEAAEGLLDLRGFYLQLALVADVLIGAATATAKVGTRRLDAVGRGLIDGEEFGLGEFLLLPGEAVMTKGTKMARPSARPTPFPPNAMS